MRNRLAASLLWLVMAGSHAPAEAQAPSPAAPEKPGARALSTSRRIQPLPRLVPRLELTVERTPFFREEYVPVSEFWRGRLRVGCFRRIRPATFFEASPVSRLNLVPRREASYGVRLSIHFGRAEHPGPSVHRRACQDSVVATGRACRP